MKRKWADPEFRSSQTTPERIQIASNNSKNNWKDQKYIEKYTTSRQTKEFKAKLSKNSKKLWKNEEFRNRYKTPEFRAKMSGVHRKNWQNEEFRNKILTTKSTTEFKEKMAAIYATDEFKHKQCVARANQPKVSSLQDILYSILDDLGVEYYREWNDQPDDPQCIIGPWAFDCVIPRANQKTLLVECQGEYFHNQPDRVAADQSKSSYIANNLSDKYEIKYLWEHEFKCKDRVIETIKYWLGLGAIDTVDFNLKDVAIKECPPKEYKPLLAKYHYLANAGRGGNSYGAYLGEELIGVCIFSPLARQNIKIKDYSPKVSRELSRLCIHPKYQKKNFTSWFVSRCIKQLNPQYKCVISYCDTTFNHDGAVYKACNFKEDHKVPPDYWYVDESGWVMHKKTLYNHAVSMSMKETDYALKMGYVKVWGKEKIRFVYER